MKKYFIFALMGIGIGCGCYLSVSAMQTSEMNKSKVVETTVEPIVIETVKTTVDTQLYLQNSEKIVKSPVETTSEETKVIES